MKGLLSEVCMALYRDNVSICAFFTRWVMSRFMRNPFLIALDFAYIVCMASLFKWLATFNAFFSWWVSMKFYPYSALAVGMLFPWFLSRLYFCLVLKDKFPVCRSGRCRSYMDYSWAVGTWFGISVRKGKICHDFFCNCSHHYLYSGGRFHLLGEYPKEETDGHTRAKTEKRQTDAFVPDTIQKEKKGWEQTRGAVVEE